MLERDPGRLERHLEALGRRRRGDDRERRVRVAAEHDLEEVRLLVLRRHAGRRAGSLDVDDDERQLDHDREPDRLGLEGDPGARRCRHPERSTIARPDR